MPPDYDDPPRIDGFPWIGESSTVFVRQERGRWAVYVRTEGWGGEDGPFEVVESRINDYPTEQAAQVAASWIQRMTNKGLEKPNFGN